MAMGVTTVARVLGLFCLLLATVFTLVAAGDGKVYKSFASVSEVS